MGNNGVATETRVVQQNPKLEGQWDKTVTAKVRLPYAIHYSSYLLNTDSMETAQQIAAKLKNMDSAILLAEASYGLSISPSWTLATASGAAGCPNETKGDKEWPFRSLPTDWSHLDQIGRARAALVAILDTGIAEDVKNEFPMWENLEPGKNATLDEFSSLCIDDSYGCNFVQPATDPVDDCAVPSDYHHGTHIAGLVSGRLYRDRAELDKRLELMVLKVADSKAQINPAAVLEGMRYAFSHGANIVNLSLTGPRTAEMSNVIQNEKNTLFVAAAGNPQTGEGTDLDKAYQDHTFGYPARWSKKLPNVIAVASHDGTGKLDCFSNFGPDSIDLAAPGFEVISPVSAADKRPLSGTSQATALVSLTAAILFSQGITSPAAIKHRILASTDYKPELRNKVLSSGILNISKSTQFTKDLLQFKDFHIENGEILEPLFISVDGERNDLALRGEVYKIVPHSSSEVGKEIRVTYLRGGRFLNGYSPHLGHIKFRTDKGESDISPDDLIDIVPRMGRVHPR
jgi:subtilisin family serine protease